MNVLNIMQSQKSKKILKKAKPKFQDIFGDWLCYKAKIGSESSWNYASHERGFGHG